MSMPEPVSRPHDDDAPRVTRDDLVQVEHAYTSLALEMALRKRQEEPDVVASEFLGAPTDSLAAVSRTVAAADAEAVQLELRRQLDELGHGKLAGANPAEPITWETAQLGGERVRVPHYLSVEFPAGTASTIPLYVRAWPKNDQTYYIHVYARPGDEAQAEEYLEQLVSAARGERSPYFHRIVEAMYGPGGLLLRRVDLETIDRASLVLRAEVWDAVHRNVDRMFDRMNRLSSAGLGTNRGLILAGPPGTGKSALCRALALEYQGRATVAIVAASAGQYILGQTYERLNELAPSLVLIEDLDLLVGDRDDRERFPLVQFLTVLDGLMTHHSRVVTIATTNDAALVDAAALRAARFDQVVVLDLPDVAQRAEILSLYLRAVAHDADVNTLARASEGFSPADLREIVRGAVLDTDDEVVHHGDLAQALDRRRRALAEEPLTGLYR
jgi:predicted AAA+ superfamily ATPase